MNKCLSKFYFSVRRKDGSFYKKTGLLLVQAALNHHLKSLPHNKFSAGTAVDLCSEGIKGLDSYLKQLISRAIYKILLTCEAINKKLCDKVLLDASSLRFTSWFISICFGKRVAWSEKPNFHSLEKSVLCLTEIAEKLRILTHAVY